MSKSFKDLLTRTASETWGLFPPSQGLLINGRYKVIRLLGYGQYSTVVLAADMNHKPHRLYAIKILSAFATSLNLNHSLNELSFLQEASAVDRNDVLPYLSDTFEILGPHGRHLCFVLAPLSTDLRSFALAAPKSRLPLHTVQLLVTHILMSLTTLHRLGIIHTDVKPSNALFNAAPDMLDELDSTEAITDGTVQIDGQEYPVLLPQPLQHSFKWDDLSNAVELYDLVLIDLGSARRESDPQDYKLATPTALRAPEIIMRTGYCAKLDIWAIGCLTFELLTGMWAFCPRATESYDVDDDHLARMMELTCEPMPASILCSEMAPKYFNSKGDLTRIGVLHPVSIEATLSQFTSLTPKEIRTSADFIRACLHLDQNIRPSADQLQKHPWLLGACMLMNYRPISTPLN